MTVRCWWAGILVSGPLVLGSIFTGLRGPRGSSLEARSTAAADEESPLSYVGTYSCSARACHGSLSPVANKRIRKDEYTVCMTKDLRHAGAYAALSNERSKRIARNLGAATGQVIEATRDSRCLACHSIPATKAMYGELAEAGFLRDGVSCESCHGPARGWLEAHTISGWRELPAEKKRQYGMTPTRDLSDRVQICVGCHIGAPRSESTEARDAYHDIMAAGHPRLSFEYCNFLANMPHHWNESQEQDFEARVWSIGQIASLHAALKLLEARANNKSAPWPEFAEYDCFACHHDLSEPSWRQASGYAGRKAGSLPWGTWYLPLSRHLGREKTDVLSALADLEKTMNGSFYPDRKKAADQAHLTAAALEPWLKATQTERYDEKKLHDLIAQISKNSEQISGASWDGTVQLYLAYIALNRAYGNKEIEAALGQIYGKLKMPDGFESPKGFSPPAQNEALKKIQQIIGK